jgi:hypothetical protein
MKFLLLGALLWLSTPALVQAQADTAPTRLTLSEPTRGGLKGHLTLRAVLAAADGKALGERQVTFYGQSTVFGAREVVLGSATTDSTGLAAIDFQPTQLGEQTMLARFRGDDVFAAAQASGTLDVREIVPIYSADSLPLASVRQWLPLGLASLVLATWGVLLGITAVTVLGVRAVGRQQQTRVSTAHVAPEGRGS